VAVVTRVRHLAVRRQVHGPQERRAAGHSVQPSDAHGHRDRRSHKNMEIQHDEGEFSDNKYCVFDHKNRRRFNATVRFVAGVEHQLGSQTHDGAVRRGKHNIRLPVGRLQSHTRIHRRLHILVDAF